MSDPNGWVLNPPTKFVKIHSLASQAALNGQFAVVVGYLDDSRRYVVVLTSNPNRQVSLRVDNLVPCGYLDSIRAQYQVVAGNPVLRQQASEAWDRQVRPRLPPMLQNPKSFAAAIGATLMVTVYLLGFSRTMLAISFVILASMVVGPILQQTTDPRAVLRQIVPQTQLLLRQTGYPLASRVADNTYLTIALLGVIVTVFVSGMIPPSRPSLGAATATTSSWWKPPSTAGAATPPSNDREHYYKLGFDDAVAQRAFGTSLPARLERKLDETTLDLSSSDVGGSVAGRSIPSYYGAPPPPSRRKNVLGIGNVASIAYTGNVLYQLGMSGDGGRWSVETLYRNVSAMPTWRIALLGLSIYRIVSAVFG